MKHQAAGTWYCELVDQEQSDEQAGEFGEYDDHGISRAQEASRTSFAGATLELFEDGRYELRAQDHNGSRGTWSIDDGALELREAEDCINGYDGLEWASCSGERLTLGFKLNADSHDGLDILVLQFGRGAPKQAGAAPVGLVASLLAAEDDEQLEEILQQAFDDADDPAAQAEALWDAWVEGQIAADPDADTYSLQAQVFEDERVSESGGFRHRHARHALTSLDPKRDFKLRRAVCDAIRTLPEDPDADAELAPLLAGPWLEELVRGRFSGTPEALFERPLMPQPQTDEATRARLAQPFNYFSSFDGIDKLYPPGHEGLPGVVFRYRGKGLLDRPLALIEARGIESEVLAAALAWIEQHPTKVVSTPGYGAMLFAVVLLARAGQQLPTALLDALVAEGRGNILGRLSPEEAARVRELVAGLPDEHRARVHKRFWLD